MLQLIEYNAQEQRFFSGAYQELKDKILPPGSELIQWLDINLEGVDTLEEVAKHFQLHPLTVEDVEDTHDLIFIPNNTVFSNEVINYTKGDVKKTSIDFQMDLTYIDSIPELEADLPQAISNYHHHIQKDSFTLRIECIKKDEVHMVFQYILNEPNRELERDIRKVTIRHIVHIIKAHQQRVRM